MKRCSLGAFFNNYTMESVRPDSARKIGFKGEDIAAKWLALQGFDIIKRNFYIRGGEIDIIALDGNTLVFVEVKFRTTEDFGRAEDHFGKKKRMRFKKTALHFLKDHGQDYNSAEIRFDFITVTQKKSGKLHLKHFKNIDTQGA